MGFTALSDTPQNTDPAVDERCFGCGLDFGQLLEPFPVATLVLITRSTLPQVNPGGKH